LSVNCEAGAMKLGWVDRATGGKMGLTSRRLCSHLVLCQGSEMGLVCQRGREWPLDLSRLSISLS